MPRVERAKGLTQQKTAGPRKRRQSAETFDSAGGAVAQGREQLARAQGAAGEALAGLGNQITQTAGAVLTDYQRAQRIEAERRAEIEYLEGERLAGELQLRLETEARQKRGRDALGIETSTLEAFDKDVDEQILPKLTSQRAKQAFERARINRRLSLAETVGRHAQTQLDEYERETVEASLATSVNAAVAHADSPHLVAEELDKQEAVLKQHGTRLGMSPEAVTAQIAKYRSATHVGVVRNLIALGRDRDARDYFEVVRDAGQVDAGELAELQRAVTVSTTEGEAERQAEAIWQELGPKGDADPISLDQMEARARALVGGNVDVLKATIATLRSRKQGVDDGRRERQNARNEELWGAVLEGRSWAEIRRLPQAIANPAELLKVRDYLDAAAAREESRASARESRLAAAENRAYTRQQRQQQQLEINGWSEYFRLSEPQQLRRLSRGDILAQLPTIGRDHVQRLLNDHEQLQKSDDQVRAVTYDDSVFKDVANAAGIDYAYKDSRALKEHERANLGRLKAEVYDAIGREQQARGKALTPEEKRAVMQGIVDQRVMMADAGWFYFDQEVVAAVVAPDDRAKTYVPLERVDQNGRMFKDAINYLRGLPGAAGLTDTQLRDRYRPRIEKAIGRRLVGGSASEVENALKGVD
jgi:hypothetical protein